MKPDQGDIVLVPVPFTDLSSSKRRPVVVISNRDYNRKTADVVVVAMTSNPTSDAYTIPITSDDLDAGVLNRPGFIRADKIYTLARAIVVKKFGRVNDSLLGQIRILIDRLTAVIP